MKSNLFPALNDIIFAEKSGEEIEAEIISTYETLAERTLAKGDPVRLFLEAIVLIIIHQRSLIDNAAKMNLLAYATGDYLDHIGALLGVTRLGASSALTTLKITLSEVQDTAILIPEGTRATADGTLLFATTEAVEIPAGDTSITVTAQCTTTGEQGNGFIVGQIKRLVDPFPYEMAVENISESYGGSDVESDENFRERIQIAPESFSAAGPTEAYKYFARSAHADIIDVAVVGPGGPDCLGGYEDLGYPPPGHVNLYLLMTGGNLPTQEILDTVFGVCNAEDIRPDTDFLHVKVPEVVSYDVEVVYYIDRRRATQAAQIQIAVNTAINSFISWQKSKLGRDINPSELNHRIVSAGAKRAEIISPDFTVLKAWEIGIENSIKITFGGLEDG